MSSYASLKQLLNTIEGMTALRNNSANDDSVDTVTGVDWFTFNGVVASNVYVSGNSFVGFGSNSEHLKICRRDGKMYYLYRQEGIVGTQKFLKIRWQGYTYYSSTNSQYALVWELFLFDDGGIYLNVVTVPSNSSYLGTSQLICGSNTYNFTVAAATPVDYSFIPDGSNGFTLSEEEYPVVVEHITSGFVEFSTTQIQRVSAVKKSKILWKQKVPDGTKISVYAKLSNSEYSLCKNGGAIPCIDTNADLTNEVLYIKIEMSTEDAFLTPELSDLVVQVFKEGDDHVLILKFDKGNINSIQNAVGEINVEYSGGTLRGLGGQVADFKNVFMPTNLVPKNNPHMQEHIELTNAQVVGNLIRIYYKYTKEAEHIEISNITPVGLLKHVNDI